MPEPNRDLDALSETASTDRTDARDLIGRAEGIAQHDLDVVDVGVESERDLDRRAQFAVDRDSSAALRPVVRLGCRDYERPSRAVVGPLS